MPLLYPAFHHGSCFEDRESGVVYYFERSTDLLDSFALIELESNLEFGFDPEREMIYSLKEGSRHAGYSAVSSPSDRFLLERIFLAPDYRAHSLGSLFLYIISTEVRLNGGRCLYALRPEPDVMNFYLRLGFYPDPDTVSSMEVEHGLSGFKGSSSWKEMHRFLDQKLKLSREYSLWKVSVDLLFVNLCGKMCDRFRYKRR